MDTQRIEDELEQLRDAVRMTNHLLLEIAVELRTATDAQHLRVNRDLDRYRNSHRRSLSERYRPD